MGGQEEEAAEEADAVLAEGGAGLLGEEGAGHDDGALVGLEVRGVEEAGDVAERARRGGRRDDGREDVGGAERAEGRVGEEPARDAAAVDLEELGARLHDGREERVGRVDAVRVRLDELAQRKVDDVRSERRLLRKEREQRRRRPLGHRQARALHLCMCRRPRVVAPHPAACCR